MGPEEAERLLNETTHAVTEGGTPLRCIQGRVDDIVPAWRTGTRGAYLQFMYKLVDVEVCVKGSICGDPACKGSLIPYPWKTAEMPPLSQASSSQSAWGVWSDSIAAIADSHPQNELQLDRDDSGRITVGALRKKAVQLKFTPNHVMRRQDAETQKWGEVALEAWEVMSIEGRKKTGAMAPAQVTAQVTAPPPGTPPAAATTPETPETIMIDLMDGKKQVDYNPAVLTNQAIKDSPLFTEYVGAQEALMQRLVAEGKVVVDEDGTVHKV